MPEIKHLAPGVPFILVGTQTDRRRQISTEMAENLAKETGAYAYHECSAKTRHGLNKLFEVAVSATVNDDNCQNVKTGGIRAKVKRTCILL